MRGQRVTWVVFGLCFVVVCAGLAWVTRATLRLDRARREARVQAVLEENTRLALWRMDSAISSLVAHENARPYFTYSSFYPAERAYTRMFEALEPGDVLIPSPLLTESSPYIRLRFQLEPDGALTSPRVPMGGMRGLAQSRFATRERIEQSTRLLEELAGHVKYEVFSHLPANAGGDSLISVRFGQPPAIDVPLAAETRGKVEWERRLQVSNQAAVQNLLSNRPPDPLRQPAEPGRRIEEGLMHPVWVDDLLFLARRVSIDDVDYIQGCWLDWASIKAWLLPSVSDLFPAADLEPWRMTLPGSPGRQLAALPVRFLPGPGAGVPDPSMSPLRLSLVLIWIGVLLAMLTAVTLLVGVTRLSERRATFVSAVTHELRTPLTTLRMYAEMLAHGMVRGEEKRNEYLTTLMREAERLHHLVENVLAHARLEKGRLEAHREETTVRALINRVAERLSTRGHDDQRPLFVQIPDEIGLRRICTDTTAVEQILFNLVDNACKYAVPAADPRIHLEAAADGDSIRLRVRDHGPGVAAEDRVRLFRPFSRSARDAAGSAPGVGLGLALSRRLARRLKGDLALDPTVPDGAGFVLVLRLDAGS